MRAERSDQSTIWNLENFFVLAKVLLLEANNNRISLRICFELGIFRGNPQCLTVFISLNPLRQLFQAKLKVTVLKSMAKSKRYKIRGGSGMGFFGDPRFPMGIFHFELDHPKNCGFFGSRIFISRKFSISGIVPCDCGFLKSWDF